MSDCQAERHDTLYAYNRFGCRCPTARKALARQTERRRLRVLQAGHGLLIDATGTMRRLRALAAIGWNTWDLADAVGSSQCQVRRWMLGVDRVHVDTAARVAAVYNRLSGTPGTGPRVYLTRNWANRNGWLAPAWWDDDTIDDPAHIPPVTDNPARDDVDPVVVERLCTGERLPHTRAERLAAVTTMYAAGMSWRAIGDRLHVHSRQVTRDIHDLGLTRRDVA